MCQPFSLFWDLDWVYLTLPQVTHSSTTASPVARPSSASHGSTSPAAAWVDPEERAAHFVGALRLEILSCSLVAAKGKGKEHARYTIAVLDKPTDVCWWKVTRRYSEFETLVKDLNDPAVTKHLPKKGWGFGGSKLKVAEGRIDGLDLLLAVLSQPQHLSNSAVKTFFDVPV